MSNKVITVSIICVFTVMVHMFINTLNRTQTVEEILSHQLTANRILKSQIEELVYTAELRESEVYNRGFEAGKTQLGISLMNGKSMSNYRDGYHAALEQFNKGFLPGMPADFPRPPFPHPDDVVVTGDEE